MKTIIAGSRTIDQKYSIELIKAVKTCGWPVTQIISGGAQGADFLGEQYARSNKIPLKIKKADWGTHGKGAGMIRNIEMAKMADALIVLWDMKSKGTEHMIKIAKKLGLKIHLVELPDARS